ncbi:FAD-dependent thymidylate synthase [Thermosulfurimonas marina]|uniref:FAD-dependent thymidylate synthase n=1 Tax=Thermosulfurimonas marina TaxID=2047767 RepID=A0A6H1WTM5_9BACT|nr:FAD-dependent thymidylate synthase [Thermosulfurimonas marina]QJA06499.1 FAD-dependent thymidylate synthase [Thermosulfurimonas marina]
MKDLRPFFRERAREFLLGLVRERGGEAFRRTLFLSFLGARICYAESPPLSLFAEERFRDPERLRSFLIYLQKAGHGSVFAHSPLTVELSSPSADLLSALYKAWYDPETACVQLNLRHFAEVLTPEEFQELLEPGVADREFLSFPAVLFEGPELQKTYEGPLEGLLPRAEAPGENLLARPRVSVIRVPDEEPFGWFAVVVEGFSRLFSHQFVRHTWLNFNQRSHRYTAVDQFVEPPSFEVTPGAGELYRKEIERGLAAYRRLVSLGIKKEDARFVTPQGAATTVLATGPYFVWRDFIEKRAHPRAQWEIRHLAQALGEVIS